MVVNLEVFCLLVENWVVAELNAALVIAVDVGGTVVLDFKLNQQTTNPDCFARTLS